MEALKKTDAWHLNRLTGVGGSDAKTIMEGDAEDLIRLWNEKRGEAEPEDLSDILPVQMGTWTEPFNRYWFTKQTDKAVSESPDMRECRHENGISRCELDGWIMGENEIFEAKHTNAFAKPEEIQARYYWQIMHQLLCSGADKAHLSVFYGNMKWECYEVERDQGDIDVLLEAEVAFWKCVQDGNPPVAVGITPPVAASDMRTVYAADEPFANEFGEHANTWNENQAASKKFNKADKGLKDFMASDVKELFGFGVVVKRSTNGSRRVTKGKDHADS